MIDYDFHIHTEYCGHAEEMTVEAICRRADRMALRCIAITDHIYGPDDKAVIQKIRRQAQQARPRCQVIVGAEIDVDGRFDDGRLVIDDVSDLDYVIAGYHYIPTLGHYPHSPDDCPMMPEEFLGLWEKSLLGIVSNPKVDTLAHPGRLLASCVDLPSYLDWALAVFKEAAALSARHQIAWELNELTGRRLAAPLYRNWVKIYQIALEAGVQLIYGSDAHDPDSIGSCACSETILDCLPADSLSSPEDLPAARQWTNPISS